MLVSWRVIIIIASTNLFSIRQSCWGVMSDGACHHIDHHHIYLIHELLKKYTNMQSSDFFGYVFRFPHLICFGRLKRRKRICVS